MHEKFVGALARRVLDVEPSVRSARGGHGKVITELRAFVIDVRRDRASPPDLLVVATDCNCVGHLARRKEIEAVLGAGDLASCFSGIALALPDPHIERWLLQDSKAFKRVFGSGCKAPDTKWRRDRYKALLGDAIATCGIDPLLGGVEYAEELAHAADLSRIADPRMKAFVTELQAVRRDWERPD